MINNVDKNKSTIRKLLSPRFLKYCLVSAVGVVYTEGSLYIFKKFLEQGDLAANLEATISASIVILFLYQKYVWSGILDEAYGRSARLYFGITTTLGIVVSSGVVLIGGSLIKNTVDLVIANLSSYILLWLARFFVLERVFTAITT